MTERPKPAAVATVAAQRALAARLPLDDPTDLGALDTWKPVFPIVTP